MPRSKSEYALIAVSSTGKATVITLDGKDVTKDVKASSLDRAVKEKEKYMFKHPKTTLWTREIHLKSDMWKDIEAYTSTSPVIAAPKATKSEPKITPSAKTSKVTPTAAKTVKAPEAPVAA